MHNGDRYRGRRLVAEGVLGRDREHVVVVGGQSLGGAGPAGAVLTIQRTIPGRLNTVIDLR